MNTWDNLVGDYDYIQDGNTMVSNLPFMSDTDDLINHSLWGGLIAINFRTAPNCTECFTNTRFIKIQITDPTRPGTNGSITMAHFIENGIEKIRLRLLNTGYIPFDPALPNEPQQLSIPEGVYTFVKQ